MKLKMLVGLSGPTFTLEPGDLYDCQDDGEATRLMSARYAVPWVEEAVETATVATPAVETRAPRDPLDHDNNGRKGGSLPRKKKV